MQEYDMVSMMKDIDDRMKMIQDYKQGGYLDRVKAINMIQELRLHDVDVAQATLAKITPGSVPFSLASDQDIVAELKMQAEILLAKLT